MNVFGDMMADSLSPMLWSTGTLLDHATGWYERGIDNKWYLIGGLPQGIFGIHGRENTFKSTLVDGWMMGAMRIHQEAYGFGFDTEGIKNKIRVAGAVDDILHNLHDTDAIDRLVLHSGAKYHINNVFKHLKDIVARKEQHEKVLKRDIPIVDPTTGQRRKVWVPTFVQIDSLTELESEEEATMLDSSGGLEDKKNKTIWLVDGNKKTLLIRYMRKIAEKYGICFICTAHTGNNMSMDPRQPPSKQLLYMKQKDRIKGAGSRFSFLTHVLTQNAAMKVLQDSGKATLYPQGTTVDNDIVEIANVIQRNKSNSSGTMIPYVSSQETGMLNTVTNLHYIRVNGYDGLNGGPSKPKHACVWYPEVNFSRKTVRDLTDADYALARAIELTAQYRFIQTHWNLSKMPFDFNMTTEEIFDKVTNSSADMRDVLQSTGNWSYSKTEREYMSLFDFMEQIS